MDSASSSIPGSGVAGAGQQVNEGQGGEGGLLGLDKVVKGQGRDRGQENMPIGGDGGSAYEAAATNENPGQGLTRIVPCSSTGFPSAIAPTNGHALLL